jgi:hypothetical protein
LKSLNSRPLTIPENSVIGSNTVQVNTKVTSQDRTFAIFETACDETKQIVPLFPNQEKQKIVVGRRTKGKKGEKKTNLTIFSYSFFVVPKKKL